MRACWIVSAAWLAARCNGAALRGGRRLMEVELLQEDEADALKAAEERQFALASAKVAAEDAAVGLAAVAQEAAETIVASATETMVEEAAVSQQRATLVEDLAAGAVVTEDGSDRYAVLAREAAELVTQLRDALDEESKLLNSLNEKLAVLAGKEGEESSVSSVSSVSGDASSLVASTWNMAAINNNPFEYWITYEGEGGAAYETLMARVSDFIGSPGDRDVRVSEVFTDDMFEELLGKIALAGMGSLTEVASAWRDDFSQRLIISGVLKDASLGAKRLMSMPDRVTNTVALADGTKATRPTVVNCYASRDLGSREEWWAQWRRFMFEEQLTTSASAAPKTPAAMLSPILHAKYPAITEEEELISVPLSTLALAVFDAILVHVLNEARAEGEQDWQEIRANMCEALNEKKAERTAAILESDLYAVSDVVFLQESSTAFATYADSRALGRDLFDFKAPADADPSRDQNSLILLRKGAWRETSEVSAGVLEVLATDAKNKGAKMPVAPGDVTAYAATRAVDGKKFLLCSFHGDTNGLATAPVLAAVHAFRTLKLPDHALLFGLDANVHAEPDGPGSAFVGDFAAQFRDLGMASCYGTDPDPHGYTTFNARTYLQPQLNKAVKAEDKFTSKLVDRNPKDFILFYASDFQLTEVAKDNTGRGEYIDDIVFPTLNFPSDHAVTRAVLAPLP